MEDGLHDRFTFTINGRLKSKIFGYIDGGADTKDELIEIISRHRF